MYNFIRCVEKLLSDPLGLRAAGVLDSLLDLDRRQQLRQQRGSNGWQFEETNKQIERLDQVFKNLGQTPKSTQCPAIDGIIKEADEVAGEVDDKAVLDAAIIASAQTFEHYEMCRYGRLIAWAEALGHNEIVRFLTTNLNEEKAANTKLNTVALREGVNSRAAG
jgi:ferritin-like metal-binding protein YciE